MPLADKDEKTTADKAPSWLWWALAGVSIVIVLILGWMLVPPKAPIVEKPTPITTPTTPYDPFIYEASGKYGVDANLIKAVIQQESGFNPQAIGSKGEKGLMQLMPNTITRYGVSDPFDPRQNIDGGTHYLSDLLKKYNGQTDKALQAYNAGEDAVDKGEIPDSTRDYITQVMSYWEAYKSGNVVTTPAIATADPIIPFQNPKTVSVKIAPVGEWSEKIEVPSMHLCQIFPQGKIKIRFQNGTEIEDEPGKINRPGENLPDADFFITSRENQEVKVVIIQRPK